MNGISCVSCFEKAKKKRILDIKTSFGVKQIWGIFERNTTAFLQRNITTLALEIIQQEASKGEGWRTSTPHTRFHSNLLLPPPIKKIEFYILLITIQNVQLLSTVTLALIAYGYNGGMPEDTLVTLVLHVSIIFIFTVVITALLSSHINCLQFVWLPQWFLSFQLDSERRSILEEAWTREGVTNIIWRNLRTPTRRTGLLIRSWKRLKKVHWQKICNRTADGGLRSRLTLDDPTQRRELLADLLVSLILDLS